MDLMSYLTIVRQRWTLILAAVVAALGVTWMSIPSAPEQVAQTVNYQATATLVGNPHSEAPMSLATAGLYATVGEVPIRAAKVLQYKGEPQVLASTVAAASDPETGTLTISTTGTDPEAAARTANVFADELVRYFERSAEREAERQRDYIARTLSGYSDRIAALDRQIARRPGATDLVAEREGLETQYSTLVAQSASLDGPLAAGSPVTVLQSAVPIPQATGGFTPPSSPRDRLIIGAVVGLVLGLALALLVERLDSRLRTREQVEQALELPVLAEIPAGTRAGRKDRRIVSAVEPGSAIAEAHRALRSTVFLMGPAGRRKDEGRAREATAILVTSARPGEGKTTTVANLAVTIAESGRKVLVLSLDFHGPTIHDFFDVPAGAGLSDLLFGGRAHELRHIVRETSIPGVSIATAGQELAHPGSLLSGVQPLIEEARRLADVVLIDSAPLLAVSDALDISPHVDAVLMVTKARRTTAAQAKAAQRLLARLGVPVLGAVLIAGKQSSTLYGYSYGSAPARHVDTSPGGTRTAVRAGKEPATARLDASENSKEKGHDD